MYEPTDVHEVAKDALTYFETDGEHIKLKDSRPNWVYQMVYEAHNGMFPDDFKYEYVKDALSLLSETNSDNARELIESDIYTSDLLLWLASNANRLAYCDEAAGEFGCPAEAEMTERISLGQHWEREEVFGYVLSALEAQAEGVEK